MTEVLGVPVVDGDERIGLLEPATRERVRALCADPRMRGQLKVESAVRTKAEQTYLYNLYLSGHGNLAANPNQTLTPYYGLSRAEGSWHMQQSDGFGYAVDFNSKALTSDVYAALPIVAAEYRLVQTVLKKSIVLLSPPPPAPANPAPPWMVNEWWHFQAPYNEGPLTWVPDEEDEMTPEQAQMLEDVWRALEPGDHTNPRSPLRKQIDDVHRALEPGDADTARSVLRRQIDEIQKSTTATARGIASVLSVLPKASWFDGMANAKNALLRVLGAEVTDEDKR